MQAIPRRAPAVAADRQPARPLAPGGRRRRAPPRVVLARGGRRARRSRTFPEGAFKVSLDGDLPPVRADAAQLERAFANLLENAYRHSNGHPVSVRARDVGGRILVRVVDRGPGIPKAQQERMFEPFYRSGTQRTGHRGSGLGLAIVRGFVEANGGRGMGRIAPRPGHLVRGRAARRALRSAPGPPRRSRVGGR